MPETRIGLDPTNPGQFFACCGLLEWMSAHGIRPESRFETDSRRPRQAEFVVETDAAADLDRLVRALRTAHCQALECADGLASVAPLLLTAGTVRLELDWWLDEFRTRALPWKCWAGQQTSESILTELLTLLPEAAGVRLLDAAAMTTSRFGVDPRSAWTALDFGFSPNEQGKDAATFPATEALAVIGLQGFRPGRHERRYHYALWRHPLRNSVARLAAAGGWDGSDVARYEFALSKRGSYKFFEFAQGVKTDD